MHNATADMTDDVTRPFPHSVPAEKSVLSSMLQYADYIGKAVEAGLTAEHFYDPGRGILFEFIVERLDAGLPTDLETLFQPLIDAGKLDKIGGPGAFTDLYTYAPSTAHFEHHVGILKDKMAFRRLLNFCNEQIAAVYDSPDEIEETLDAAEKGMMAIREGRDALGVESVADAVRGVLSDFEARVMGTAQAAPGIATGFEELDRMTGGGPKAGNMFVIAARPSMGKTSFLMNIAEHICFECEKPVMIFSLEMTRRELIQRMLFSRAKFDSNILSSGEKPNKGDLIRIQREAKRITDSRLVIDDTPAITISQLRAKARRVKAEKNIAAIGIDYIQLMRSFSKQAVGSREREISEISAGVKALSKELNIPIFILAQLNRGPESRTGKKAGKPRMSDLRDSGSIEQDADMVGLLYRDAYYAEDDESKAATAGRAELDLAKNRNGPTGAIPLTFVEKLSRFESGAPASEFREPSAGKGWDR